MKSTFKILIISALLLIGGCTEEQSPTEIVDVVELLVSPDTVVFQQYQTSATLYLSTSPASETKWVVSEKPDWISISPDSGTINSNIVELPITVVDQGLMPGSYLGHVNILTDRAGEASVLLRLELLQLPRISVDVSEISFSATEQLFTLPIYNTGSGILNYSLSSDAEWLRISPDTGSIPIWDSVSVEVSVNREQMAVGTYNSQIELSSNTQDSLIVLPVDLEVIEFPFLSLSTNELALDYGTDTTAFLIYNKGNISFSWTATTEAAYVQLSAMAGNIEAGDSATVQVVVDRTDLATGSYEPIISIENEVNQTAEITLKVDQYYDNKSIFSHDVVDAVYDRTSDQVLMVGINPNKLYIYHPESKSELSYDLPQAPTCLTVNPSGSHAAIGMNGYASYFNLTTLVMENTFNVSADAIDIVLPDNGWIYVFPRYGQWTHISCINVSTGVEYAQTGYSLRAGSRAKLHPSQDYIYIADNGLSPSDFEKYDIRDDVAAYMYDSPYHGDYAFSGNIWISDDGFRLFARSGNIFRSSENQSQDMLYNGDFSHTTGQITWVDQSTAAGLVSVLSYGSGWDDPATNVIDFYSTVYVGYLGSITLSDFILPFQNDSWAYLEAGAFYSFFSNNGEQLYVLCQAEAGSNMENSWAIAAYDVADLPLTF